MKRIATIIILALALTTNSISPASAALTWSQTSTLDTTFDGSLYNPQYDLEYTTAAIFDNNPDKINFYIEFLNVPRVNVFNTGDGARGVIYLDYNFDNQADFALYAEDITLKTDITSVAGIANVLTKGVNAYSSCAVSVFTNIAGGTKWIGFSTSRTCIGLPISFGLLGLAKNNSKNSGKDYDYAPSTFFRVNLPTTSTASSSTITLPDVGATFTLPTSKANESKAASTYSDSPQDLSKLSEDLLPSVVTVQCDGGSGTGWSADVAMSSDLQAGGYKSLVVTNHHVIENCLINKSVTLVLNSKASVPGVIVSWSKNDDIAGIAVKSTIPALQWMGVNPRQGWWVGVLGSPLGVSGILTTGIISSTNSIGSRFTFTAAINPGNSGGPVFDSTGRVLGLATSKRLISADSIAEGFGSAQGTPLLCSVIVSCIIEKSPWNATPKYAASSSLIDKAATEAAAKIALDKAEAEAKAAAELKAKQEAEAKAAAELKAKQDADAKDAIIRTQIDQLIKDNADLAIKIKEQTDLISIAQEEAEALTVKIASVTLQIDDFTKVLTDTKAQLATLKADTKNATANELAISKLTTAISSLSNSITNIKTSNSSQKIQLQSINSSISKLNSSILQLKSTISKNTSSIERATKFLSDKAAAELKAKQEADAKAAAELKAKQEADAKAAAELKAKQEADAKAAAELKAKQEADAKAASELKAKQEADAKAAADLKAKQEADAKLSLDAQTKCVNHNGDLKSLKFNISIAATDYPLSKAKFQSLISLFPAEIDCNAIYLSTFDAKYNGEVRLFQNVLNSYDQALKSAKELASKKTTITCVKGKLVKKVTAVKPVCPKGYKKK